MILSLPTLVRKKVIFLCIKICPFFMATSLGCTKKNNDRHEGKSQVPSSKRFDLTSEENPHKEVLFSKQSAKRPEKIPLNINFFPLLSKGVWADFWKQRHADLATRLTPHDDLIETPPPSSKSPLEFLKPNIHRDRDEDDDDHSWVYPLELSILIKKMVFSSDESLAYEREIVKGDDHPFHLPMRLDLNMIRELEKILQLSEEGLLDDLAQETFVGPDELLAVIEDTMSGDRENSGGSLSAEVKWKVHDYLAKNIDQMVESAQKFGSQDLFSQGGATSVAPIIQPDQTPRSLTTVGPLRLKMRFDEKSSQPLREQVWIEDEQGHGVNQLLLPAGIYHSVKVYWGSLAQVKGCVPKEGELFCTRGDLSPIVKTSTISDFPKKSPEVMDIPLINESADWPLVEDYSEEYPLAIDHNGQNQLTLAYSLPHVLSFFKPGQPSLELGDLMPYQRPYFYLSGHRDRFVVSGVTIGRLYEFSGIVTECPEGNASTCRATSSSKKSVMGPHVSTIQVVGNVQGQALEFFWHGGPYGSFKGQLLTGTNTNQSEDPQALPSELADIPLIRHSSYHEETIPEVLTVRGMPLLLDSWLLGQSKSILVDGVVSSVSNQESPGAQKKSSIQRNRRHPPVKPLLKLELTRVL